MKPRTPHEYAGLRTLVELKSKYKPGYVHPVGTEATFLEAQAMPGLPNEWLIEVHVLDTSLVGDHWHEVFGVSPSSVCVEGDAFAKVLRAIRAMRFLGVKLAGRHMAAVLADALVALAREARLSKAELVQLVHEAWMKGSLDPRAKHTEPSSSCAACEENACIECAASVNEDGSPVRWRCQQCGHTVCRGCALTIPGRRPLEYYHQTLCSSACWRRIGSPDE
jgi:hypothetical protein